MRVNKVLLVLVSLVSIFALAACSSNTGGTGAKKSSLDQSNHKIYMDSDSGSIMDMDMHPGTGEVPEGLKDAKNPTFKVGSKAMIHADHMEGMNGAEATVVGAFDTTVYAVSYTPTTGGERVINHKWVIQENFEEAGDKPFKTGAKVTLAVDHMKGMKGAKAVIDSAKRTIVYMVDYTPTTGEEKVTNHQWLTEDELSSY
jgi:hypothetical protein